MKLTLLFKISFKGSNTKICAFYVKFKKLAFDFL